MSAPSPRFAAYSAGRAAARAAARERVLGRPGRAITPAQRGLDALASRDRDMLLMAIVAIGSSLLLHGVIGGIGVLFGGGDDSTPKPTIITMRERPPEPPPPPPPPPEPPPPSPEPELVIPKAPPKALPPPPDKAPPPEPPKKPQRVVGLSLDSTAGQGGDGPGFAVGNTSRGETDKVAQDPKDVKPEPGDAPPPPPPPDKAPPGPNQQASRIPGTATGGKVVLPKRKKPATLPYPETLKSQGIEADVTVIVNVDPAGKVVSVKIAKGSGFAEFDEIARRAAEAEEFEPASRDGAAIPYTLSFTYRFRLEEP